MKNKNEFSKLILNSFKNPPSGDLGGFMVFLILIFVSSCGIFRPITPIENPKKVSKGGKILDTIADNYLDYETLFIKYNAKYKSDNQNISFGGTIRIVKDSAMLITLSPGFGIELGRLLITNDSVKFYNSFQNTYLAEDKTFFETNYGLSMELSTVEAMLTNKVFTYPTTNKISDYQFIEDSTDYKYSFVQKNPRNEAVTALKHETIIDKKDYNIKSQLVEDNINLRYLDINYTDFLFIKNTFFPEKFIIKIEEKQNHELNFDYKKISVNKEFKVRLKIPKNAKQIK